MLRSMNKTSPRQPSLELRRALVMRGAWQLWKLGGRFPATAAHNGKQAAGKHVTRMQACRYYVQRRRREAMQPQCDQAQGAAAEREDRQLTGASSQSLTRRQEELC
jgi:hypothetical protein